MENKGFFKSLVDFEFKELVTLKVIPILYIIGILVAGVVGIMIFVKAFSQNFAIGLLHVIAAPIAFLLIVIISRIKMELLMTLFRIEQNTRKDQPQAEVVEAEVKPVTEPADPEDPE
ncbi:MAG: DUF4282 domain-containing protein [Sedimentisphaerales bacterium]|nr:DUF4282 domain-containing protein [Sedimentisphaerales bacterium]